ncbi:hypothetical protein ANO14919_034770 [Xylariales sp. No.14919]|nr:hypothetical protein ANO14919_034770 [Xylariales sp. No.14919]
MDPVPEQTLFVHAEITSKGPTQALGLYAEQLESRETSQVFNIILNVLPLVNGKIQGKARQDTRKLAIKRLHKTASLKKFRAELHSLQSMNTLRHPNIATTLSVFKHEENADQYLNFAFPLARGNLKRLFRGSYDGDIMLQQRALVALWNQFLGLSSALAHIDGKVNIAHRDIKPSNILIYEEEPGGPILKITDLGLSSDLSEALAWELGTLDLRSAWTYDSPELRQSSDVNDLDKVRVLTSKKLLSNEIWKLGCVFTELLAYLVAGESNSVSSFRGYITTTEGSMPSDFFNDTRFDDDERVKLQVYQWLDNAAKDNDKARQLQPTLKKMLAPSSKRPSAEEICPELIELSLSETRYHDGIRVVRFTPGPNVEPPTAVERIETWLGCPIDWRPFRGTSRICPASQTLVNWTFYVVVNDRDRVLPESKGLPPPTQIEYEHGFPEPFDIQMRLAGIKIVEGLLDPPHWC